MWQDKLNLWALHGHSRRGLERLANSAHGNVRKDDQYRYQQVVLRAQQELKLTSLSTTAVGTPSAAPDPFAEKLRQISTRMSHKARQFAQMMGEADAHAARNSCSTSTTAAVKYHSNQAKSLGSSYVDDHSSQQQQQQPRRRLNRLADLPRRSSTLSSPSHPSQQNHTTTMGRATAAAIQPQFTIRTRTRTQNPATTPTTPTTTSNSNEVTTTSPPSSLSWRTTARMA